MKRMTLLLAISVGLLGSLAIQADTLLVDRVQSERADMPKRGATMAQVEARFGPPQRKFEPVGGPGPRKNNPPITRWMYPAYNVYFEHNHVVDAVQVKASPTEMGPAPVRQ